ncbi:hypothetical protein K0B04_02860 [Patescibacteria group bacterium]|nr:hypothetical protein [Patescibacteria group bacterium]
MRKKPIIITILVFLLILTAFFVFKDRRILVEENEKDEISYEQSARDTDTPNDEIDEELEESLSTYNDTENGFSFNYPNYLKPEAQQDGSLWLGMYGPTQATQTEFYDGISVGFQVFPLENQNLRNVVENKRLLFADLYGDEVSEISNIDLGVVSGYSFSDSVGKYMYVQLNSEKYLEIVNTTSDPGNLGYHKVASEIVESVKVLK